MIMILIIIIMIHSDLEISFLSVYSILQGFSNWETQWSAGGGRWNCLEEIQSLQTLKINEIKRNY